MTLQDLISITYSKWRLSESEARSYYGYDDVSTRFREGALCEVEYYDSLKKQLNRLAKIEEFFGSIDTNEEEEE